MQGWFGFSDPFLIQRTDPLQTARQILLIPLTAAAAFVAFLTPGLLLRDWNRSLSFIWTPLPGVLLLALLGLFAWFGPHAVKPRWICRSGLAILFAFAAYRLVRTPLSSFTSALERRVLLIVVLIAALATAKSIYSLGPAGELYAGRISRTLEPGGRSDSRISYHGVELIAMRSAPHSPAANEFYYPWDFSSRGPIASLAVAPLVLSSPVQLATSMPDHPWQLFDPQGFAAYRLSMIVLAACALIPAFGLAAFLLPDNWAFLAFLAAATAPFVIHEVYFTWPKLLAAAFVLWAAYLVLRARFFWAGFFVGLGYLAHPSALLWLPALASLAFLARTPRSIAKVLPSIASLVIGTAVWVLLWRFLNRGHFAQDYFLTYLKMTAGAPPTPWNWLHSRIDSALNTLLPLNLFLLHRNSPETTSLYASSPLLIRFFFQYWNTLPFGVGIAFFFAYLLRAFWLGFTKKPAYAWLVFVLPFFVFIVYWGMSRGGLAREGLHAWILGLLIASIMIWSRFPPASQTFWRICNWMLLLRAVETLLMLLLPTLASNSMLVQNQFEATDIACLLAMLGLTGFLGVYVFSFAERVRRETASRDRTATRAD